MESVLRKIKFIITSGAFFFTLLSLTGLPVTVLGQSPSTLKVMSYNIRIASPPSKGWGVTEIDSIAEVIKRINPDLVALQEVDVFAERSGAMDQAKELGRLTNMHYFFSKAVDRSGGDYGVAILSKRPIISAQAFRIYSPDSEKNENRALAIVEVLWKNQPLVFASLHLDHLDNDVRHYQMEQVQSHLKKYAQKPILIGADLNVSSDNTLIVDLEKAGYHFLEENKQQLTFPNDKPRITLDYLFFNDLFKSKNNVKNFQTIYHENYASDHLPIILIIE